MSGAATSQEAPSLHDFKVIQGLNSISKTKLNQSYTCLGLLEVPCVLILLHVVYFLNFIVLPQTDRLTENLGQAVSSRGVLAGFRVLVQNIMKLPSTVIDWNLEVTGAQQQMFSQGPPDCFMRPCSQVNIKRKNENTKET